MSKKRKWWKMSNRFRRLLPRRYVVVILAIYFIICVAYYYLFLSSYWALTKAFLNRIDADFAVSFSASLLEDLIIFFLLSISVIILTSKDLFDEKFENKVRAIINSKHSMYDEGIIAYLIDNISKSVIYDKQVEFQIMVTDYSDKDEAYKLFIEYRFKTANMCSDKDYKTKEFSFNVSKSDATVNNEHGAVTLLEIIDHTKSNSSTKFIDVATPHSLDKDFKKEILLEVMRDCEIETVFKFNCWSKTSAYFDPTALKFWNYLRVHKYVENFNVIIKNQLYKDLKFDIYINRLEKKDLSSLDKGVILSSGDQTIPVNSSLFPGDDVRVFFYK